MDLTAFETWLGEISALSEPQRRFAWQALALSETADSRGLETLSSVDGGFDHAVASAPQVRPATVSALPATSSVSKAA